MTGLLTRITRCECMCVCMYVYMHSHTQKVHLTANGANNSYESVSRLFNDDDGKNKLFSHLYDLIYCSA